MCVSHSQGEDSPEAPQDQPFISWASASGVPTLVGCDRSPSPPEQREQLLDTVESILASAELAITPIEAESVLFDSMEEIPASPKEVEVMAGVLKKGS